MQAPFDPGLVEDRAALADRRYTLLVGDLADPVNRLHDLPPETDVDRLVPDLSAELTQFGDAVVSHGGGSYLVSTTGGAVVGSWSSAPGTWSGGGPCSHFWSKLAFARSSLFR